MTTAAILAVLLVPFAMLVFAVVVVIQHTEDDEYVQRVDDALPDDVREDLLEEFLTELCNAPTDPGLEVQQP